MTTNNFNRPTTRRAGFFSIPVDMLDNDPDLFRSVLFGLLVIGCDLDQDQFVFTYRAIGPQFDAVALADEIPTYIWADTGVEITFMRVE